MPNPMWRRVAALALLLLAATASASDFERFEKMRTTAFGGDSRPICAELPIEYDVTGSIGAYKSAPATPNPFASMQQNMQANTHNPNERLAAEVRAQAAWPEASQVEAQFRDAIVSALRDAGIIGRGADDAGGLAEPTQVTDCPYRLYVQARHWVRVDLTGVVIVMQATLMGTHPKKPAYRGRIEADGPIAELLAIGKPKARQPVFLGQPAATLSELIRTTAERAGRALAYDLRVKNPRDLGKRRVTYPFGWGLGESLRWAAEREGDLLLRSSASLRLVARPAWVAGD